jgi:spermidine synthase
METTNIFETENNSSLWIQNLVNGLSGITIRAKHSLYHGASPFQKIEIFQTYSFGKILVLADNIVLTEKDEYIYHEAIVHPALMICEQPKKICIIGGGDGGCLRELIKYKEIEDIIIVEIDKMVKEAVCTHFPNLAKSFTDKRSKVEFAEGCSWLSKCKDTFDIIIVDSYDPGGPVQSLETAQFYKLVYNHLNEGGIAVFQTDSPTIKTSNLRATISSISTFFKSYKPYICSMPSFPESICSFVICTKDNVSLDAFNEKRYSYIAKKCKYYNSEIHKGAFYLPEYIKKVFS